jgi:pimeloyl-ACP methyl ester carboxylesterase
MPDSRLVPVREPADPAGVVLVLHGGAGRRERRAVSPSQLSVLRMVPIARRIAAAGGKRLAVYRLLNSSRGWDPERTPVDDVRWALSEVADVPAVLVGHSLGGRAALLAGVEPAVRGVVALNPWVYETDDADLSGRRVLIVAGDQDRIADPARSARVATALRRTTDVDYVTVPGGKHAMLAHHATFDRLASDFAVETLA